MEKNSEWFENIDVEKPTPKLVEKLNSTLPCLK
jgi:hypothetical protein